MFHKTLIFCLVLFLATASVVFCATTNKPSNPSNPWFDATGGPDAYGYTWVDSDEPGGPTYQWIDITGYGTEIEGMGDDNYVGPLNIGFEFTYYWYGVTQFYAGSNGYLKFPPPVNIASAFPTTIPIADNENDFIAGYMMDFTFDIGGEAWYWSNNTDTLIVSFINVPCWSTIGSHTFQFILENNDHTITVNYGYQEGTTYSNDILIGIENINGQVGLLHSADTYIPHNDYTVQYYRPDTTTYVVHDFALYDVVSDGSKALFLETGDTYTPSVWVKNSGNQTESGATINCGIKNSMGQYVYTAQYTLGTTSPGDVVLIPFASSWTASATGQYAVESEVILTGDMNPNNDEKIGEVEVVTLPGELLYDDGDDDTGTAWNGDDGGFAMYFEAPQSPVDISQIRYYITTSNAPQIFLAKILDDDGSDGAPGTVLFEQSVNCPTANQWYSVTVPSVSVADGKFYVAWYQTAASSVYMGIDQTAPLSRQTWEYTGGWAPYRDAETSEAMIRATVTGAAVSDVEVALTPFNPPIQIPANGGSFQFNVELTNNTTATVNFDAWTMATLPNGSNYGPILLVNVNLNAGVSVNRDRTQNVPGGAPTGDYTYHAYVGDYPGTVWDEDSFPFEKLAADNGGGFVYSWNNSGESFTGESFSDINRSSFVIQHFASPNPFNPSTTIIYDLKEAAEVQLVVFDISGREVASLVDGWVSEGVHSAVFNAENLASGIYFYRLQAGDFSATKKMILMK